MKKYTVFLLLFVAPLCAFSQELTARNIADAAIATESPQAAVSYIQSQLEAVSAPAEKRALYSFLGMIQESLALYDDAKDSYVAAAGISAGDAAGMPKKSSEVLVLDAVRCALSAGDGELALQFLNSAVRNAKSEKIQARIKLYEQWAALSRAEDVNGLDEPVAMLKAYADMPSMESVNPSVLLTLWYVTGEAEFGERLVQKYPGSAEAGIVTGDVQIMPSPFWYFVPRRKIAATQTASDAKKNTPGAERNSAEKNSSSGSSAKSSASEHPVKQQLGLFRDKSNADAFVDRLKEKHFNGYVQEETRKDGSVYYVVFVDEDSSGSMSLQLKSAGFECYPVFR